MIIGISGKMGSGKDTVAHIIKYLMVGADKAKIPYEDWNGKPVWGVTTNEFHTSSWEVKKFAGKLKDILCMLTGCTREQLEDADFKSTPLGPEWDDSHGIDTPRDLLQILGTDCGREMIHKRIWENALFVDYVPVDDTARASMGNVIDYSDCVWPNWIITDMRFPNEKKGVEKRDGITVRVNTNRAGIISGHESETALDADFDFDYTIDNSGTIESLINDVTEILIDAKLLKV